MSMRPKTLSEMASPSSPRGLPRALPRFSANALAALCDRFATVVPDAGAIPDYAATSRAAGGRGL